jgi:hypothetical protein
MLADDSYVAPFIAWEQNMKISTDATNTIHKSYVPHFSIIGMQTQGYKNIKRYKFRIMSCLSLKLKRCDEYIQGQKITARQVPVSTDWP